MTHPLKLPCLSMSMLPSKQLVTGHENGDLVCWNTSTAKFSLILEAHRSKINKMVFVAPKMLITASSDLTVKLFNIEDWQLIYYFELQRNAIDLIIDGNVLYIGVSEVGVEAYNIISRLYLGQAAEHNDDFRGMYLSPS